MIILKLLGILEIPVHFKMIISKQEEKVDVFELHFQFKVMKLQLSIQKNYQIFLFSSIFKRQRFI